MARRVAGRPPAPCPIERTNGGPMKAVVYERPRAPSVEEVPDARIKRPGDSVAIHGAGPVGPMAALSCAITNAGRVFVHAHGPDGAH